MSKPSITALCSLPIALLGAAGYLAKPCRQGAMPHRFDDLGTVLLEAGLEDPAKLDPWIDRLEAVRHERPHDADSRTHLALARLLRAGSASEADPAAALELALERDPNDLEARFALGQVHLERQCHAAAESCFRAVLAARPDDLAALSSLGACLLETGRPQAAIEPLERVVAREPTRAAVWRLRQALVSTGQTAKADKALALFRVLDPAEGRK